MAEQRAGLRLCPVSLAVANEHVQAWHRHNRPVVGHKFSIGCCDGDGVLRAVAIVGRPVARKFDDGDTLEVARVASDGTRNACSMLYGAAARAGFALGYRRIVTYTQAEDTTPETAQHLRVEARAQGLKVGVWESAPDYGSMLRRASEGWDYLIEQIEGPGQYDRVLQSVGPFRELYPDMPAAIVTNFGGLTPENAKPLIAAKLDCIVECFIGENPNSTPERQLDQATRVFGWPSAQPMIGLGSGLSLADYPGYQKHAGYSVWAAEYLL